MFWTNGLSFRTSVKQANSLLFWYCSPFLDLDLAITKCIDSSAIYDKQDGIWFQISWWRCSSLSFLWYIYFAAFRLVRVCSNVDDVNNRNQFLTAKLLKQCYRYNRLYKHFLNSTTHTHTWLLNSLLIWKIFCSRGYQSQYLLMITCVFIFSKESVESLLLLEFKNIIKRFTISGI